MQIFYPNLKQLRNIAVPSYFIQNHQSREDIFTTAEIDMEQ
jgi:hypothetical protein